MIKHIKQPFQAGSINDLVIYLGDLATILTFLYYVKLNYLGFGFWFGWLFGWFL